MNKDNQFRMIPERDQEVVDALNYCLTDKPCRNGPCPFSNNCSPEDLNYLEKRLHEMVLRYQKIINCYEDLVGRITVDSENSHSYSPGDRLTTAINKIIARESPRLLKMTKKDLQQHYIEVFDKLQKYEVLEESGLIVVPPCKFGDTVYVIPSQTNYNLNVLHGLQENNRVYEQKVCEIRIFADNKYLLTTCDGMNCVHKDFYGDTWFLSRSAAEHALSRREELRPKDYLRTKRST